LRGTEREIEKNKSEREGRLYKEKDRRVVDKKREMERGKIIK
jgi:hypothetical protein